MSAEEKEVNQETCTHNCESCGVSGCSGRSEIKKLSPHPRTTIKKTIAVISGKGGVGKSTVASLLAASLAKKGHKVAIMDADVTGPSIPKAFGIKQLAVGDESGIFACMSEKGTAVMSANLLLEEETTPIIWRGSLISQFVGQLYTEVVYGDVDYMVIDMPPGTGDVPLTVFQQIPVDGVIVVASPQDLVGMIVEKSISMAKQMNVNILGIVENMAYFQCPDCGKKHDIFGAGDLSEVAKKYGVPILDQLPIDPSIAKLEDAGKIEEFEGDLLQNATKAVESL